MEKAIRSAIEGGWGKNPFNGKLVTFHWDKMGNNFRKAEIQEVNGATMSVNDILLDPLFWQALGKAEGWKEDDLVYLPRCQTWSWKWHRFIDHIADGKSIDSFFGELLK